eukprot:scaffold429167_cov17-Prasinocladus_malaysianus.AAC.1
MGRKLHQFGCLSVYGCKPREMAASGYGRRFSSLVPWGCSSLNIEKRCERLANTLAMKSVALQSLPAPPASSAFTCWTYSSRVPYHSS